MRTRRLGVAALAVLAGMVAAAPAAAAGSCPILRLVACAEPPAAPPVPPTPTVPPAPVLPPPTVPVPTPTQAATRLLTLVNGERRAAGLVPLTARDDVAAIAAGWSRTLAERGTLSHDDAYFSPATRRRLGAAVLGENVAYAGDIETAHRTLMASEHHRANILDPRFTVAGFGVALVDGRWWVTQDFVQPATSPAPAPPAAAPRPAPVPAPPSAPSTTSTTAARSTPPSPLAEPVPSVPLRHRVAQTAGVTGVAVGATAPERGRAAVVAALAILTAAGGSVTRRRSGGRS
jgi:uncharacterized protein YkwD